jgi:hypothetical protein
MTTTQEMSLREIEDRISIIEIIKKDYKKRCNETSSRVQKQYLQEKIQQSNTELRILTHIQAGFLRTIRQYENKLKRKRTCG